MQNAVEQYLKTYFNGFIGLGITVPLIVDLYSAHGFKTLDAQNQPYLLIWVGDNKEEFTTFGTKSIEYNIQFNIVYVDPDATDDNSDQNWSLWTDSLKAKIRTIPATQNIIDPTTLDDTTLIYEDQAIGEKKIPPDPTTTDGEITRRTILITNLREEFSFYPLEAP